MVPLWQYFLEDDLDAFRHFLAEATLNAGSHKGQGSNASYKGGSPALASTSPKNTFIRNRKSWDNAKAARTAGKQDQRLHQFSLTRGDINARDAYGRTLLHHAASSSSAKALGFVQALLQVPFIDLYIQDLESGWTPLHRALYHGHISIAQALVLRDTTDLTDYTANVAHHVAGGLIKIKDHEGNSPFEVFTQTITSRDLQHSSPAIPTLGAEDSSSVNSADADDPDLVDRGSGRLVSPGRNLLGDEVFAFGSNKNLTLGLGDEDDRQFPEQAIFNRPVHLLHRLHLDARAKRRKELENQDLSSSQIVMGAGTALPALIQNQRIVIQDVVMSKLHTAVVTSDPESNVYVCGFGPGGRLGTGDESTRFSYICLQTGALSRKHVVVVALGQDHSIAVCEHGEVFTWGTNKFGQLGYTVPQSAPSSKDNPMQLTPRQLFGSMKRELIIGAAASSLHSVIFTSSSVYTFGKNEGQLGLMDADARSLEMQVVPRRVGVSILQSPISMVSAIDRATTILLESHEVVVLTHYGWTKVVFQLEGFTNYFLRGSSATRYDPAGNFISKITGGGAAVCALSTFGEVFTLDVSKKPDPLAINQSTTNPSKARNALPQPSKLWSIRKSHMAAKDIAVGQDGSIILCTKSGSVWRKEKRAKIKEAGGKGAPRMKDYKFARVPNINQVVGVVSNAFGAFAAIRKDCDVTRKQIVVDPPLLWNSIFSMLPFRELASSQDHEDSDTENPRPRFWTPVTTASSPAHVKQAVLLSEDIESQIRDLLSNYEQLADSQYDLWITSTTSDVQIPAHSFLVKARSRILRHALAEFQETYYFSIPEVLSVEYGRGGNIHLVFQGADFLTILNYVLYIYTETVVDFWHHISKRSHLASKYRQVRAELMKIGSHLDMKCLERAARVMIEPAKCLHLDMASAFNDKEFFTDADVRIELANDLEVPAHSALLSSRCPFFEGLFHGRAGGSWLNSRRNKAAETDLVRVDLKHVEEETFAMVLRHIYADTGEELFDDVVTANLDEFIDVVIEVMAVSNELMLDRLTQVCQKTLGQFVTTKNICQLLNAVAPCSVNEFKRAGLEYICLNLETMLEHRLLEELDDDLLDGLDETVQENQLACLPFARSGRAETELFDQHPELAAQVAQGRQRMVDSLRLHSRFAESEDRIESTQKPRAEDSQRNSFTSTPSINKQSTRSGKQITVSSPASNPQIHGSDMLFEMDEEHTEDFIELSPVSPTTDTQRVQDEAALNYTSPPPNLPQDMQSDGEAVRSKLDGPVANSTGSSLHKHPLPIGESWRSSSIGTGAGANPSTDIDASSKAWQSPLAGTARSDFRDIMAQASASKTSNLTLAISERTVHLSKPPGRPSQRDRKRIKHQQSREKILSPSDEASTRPDLPPFSGSPKSPWQNSRKLSENFSPLIKSQHDSASVQSSPRPVMTMRQTVAGASANSKENTPVKPNPQLRSVSTPSARRPPNPLPQIHSIRHNPSTPTISSSPLGAYHSMADILAQQQGEKKAIKEAVSKRSLQEIQQEQEFQEWWDNEAKRVQEEEQASAAAAAAAEDKGGRGRGRGRGGYKKGNSKAGAGTGLGSVNDDDTPKLGADGPSREDVKTKGRSPRRGRGAGPRGQGRTS